MEINLPFVVVAPNEKKVYKKERILYCGVLFQIVKPRFLPDTRSKRTLHYYRQFALSLGKESPYTFSKFNPLNTDIPLIPTLSMARDCPHWGGLIVLCSSHYTGKVIIQGLYQDSTVQHYPINYPSFLALCYFLIVPSSWPYNIHCS